MDALENSNSLFLENQSMPSNGWVELCRAIRIFCNADSTDDADADIPTARFPNSH